jgi:imidazolonepropionase-like amidohydrolase
MCAPTYRQGCNILDLYMGFGRIGIDLDGPLGVIKASAYADLLLVNGNPLDDILLLTDPQKNLNLIMKDGKIYKNQL